MIITKSKCGVCIYTQSAFFMCKNINNPSSTIKNVMIYTWLTNWKNYYRKEDRYEFKEGYKQKSYKH